MPKVARDPLSRFIEKIEKPSDPKGCWIWRGTVFNTGYGGFHLSAPKRIELAHRWAYETFVGPVPDGLFVLHRCDNPPCVNPDHLFLGTHQGNMDDMAIKGRRAVGDRHGAHTCPKSFGRFVGHRPGCINHVGRTEYARGEKHGSAKLTESDIRDIRHLRIAGQTFTAIARRYGMHWTTIRSIVRGLTWTHVV